MSTKSSSAAADTAEGSTVDETVGTANTDVGNGAEASGDDITIFGYSSLPLMQYSQLGGVPRTHNTNDLNSSTAMEETKTATSAEKPGSLAIPLAASSLAQVLLEPKLPSSNEAATSSGSSLAQGDAAGIPNADNTASLEDEWNQNPSSLFTSDLWKQPFLVLAVGWQTGQVSLQTLPTGLPVAVDLAGTGDAVVTGSDTNTGSGSHTAQSTASLTTSLTNPSMSRAQTRINIREGPWDHPPPTVDVSWDATGTLLGAIDQGGTCCIWEFKYQPSWQPSTLGSDVDPPSLHEQTTPTDEESNEEPQTTVPTNASTSSTQTAASKPASTNMFSSFMSALTGMPPSPEQEEREQQQRRAQESTASSGPSPSTDTTADNTSTDTAALAPTDPPKMVPALAATVAHVSRISYPSHWKAPTCLVVDPAHKKGKTTRSLIVGFQDGRLIMTKRGGGLFQRRNDTVLYHGTNTNSSGHSSNGNGDKENTIGNYQGIECIAWRGNLVAWADAAGMKLLDVETMTRIAHVDRPTGARPSLYPTLVGLRPHLAFETSKKLLVAWGDCLMSMDFHEEAVPGEGTSVTVQRKVECTMAWELDCVAAGVAPIDEQNLLVVGVVVPEDQQEPEYDQTSANSDAMVQLDTEKGASGLHYGNELEVQIVSRSNGMVQYADILPLPGEVVNAAQYQCFSSFQLPRMDDNSEWEHYRSWAGISGGGFGDLDLTLLAAAGMAEGNTASPNRIGSGNSRTQNQRFVDPHLQWKLQSLFLEDDKTPGDDSGEIGDGDTSSVDSDDYGFVLRPLPLNEATDLAGDSALPAKPPTMVLVCPEEIVKATMSTVDDAIEHALVVQNKPALALKRALQHRRQLRNYKLEDLVERYMEAVLQLPPGNGSGETTSRPSLSLRRMTLAIQAMPVLFGGRSDPWIEWTRRLEKFPGALFLLRSHLPVRDPVLPSSLYEQALKQMLLEAEELFQKESTEKLSSSESYEKEAAQHFLDSLLAWGPTKILKEYIKLYQYSRRKGDRSVTKDLRRCEIGLQRRYLQTSAGYLHFPIPAGSSGSPRPLSSTPYDASKDDSQDSLIDTEVFLEWILSRYPAMSSKESQVESAVTPGMTTHLEATAYLRMMQGRYDLALQAYLSIGTLYSPLSIADLEGLAISSVQGIDNPAVDSPIRIQLKNYEFVLAFIDNHHLHRRILSDKTEELEGSLFSLLKLVGLQKAGDFLMEHCAAPEIQSYPTSSQDHLVNSETLPIDLVVSRLESSPPLLHWYLNLVFVKKPELYIKFPNNSIPPKAVIDLHRRHLQLYLDFAGDERNSARALSGIESYKIESKTTPLLSFLKEALPLGGISAIDTRRQLEMIRSEDSSAPEENDEGHVSSTFALELAHVIEHYGDDSEAEALVVLELYLKGAKSVMLAVAYAQRQPVYSSLLWDKLIDYCLSHSDQNVSNKSSSGGILFGTLLEAAALSGADLARLVARIPPGMVVEGLRPRLVAAVADYRLKLDIHQAAASAAADEQVNLLREVAHRSRRGTRYFVPKMRPVDVLASQTDIESKEDHENALNNSILPHALRTTTRREHHALAFTLPMR